MGRFKGKKGTILLGVMILIVVGFYFYIANLSSPKETGEAKLTKVQEVLLRDLNKNYPPSPKEVVRYYSAIAQCFYGGDYSEDELYALAMKAQELYDKELANNKSEDEYLKDLKSDIDSFAQENWVISSYTLSSSLDVEEFKEDGYEWARLYCAYSVRAGTQYKNVPEVFLLRKDEKGHWKIYGWKPADEVEAAMSETAGTETETKTEAAGAETTEGNE